MRLSDWWDQRALKRALRQYATDVRRRLVTLYGPSDTYSPGRVRRAVDESDANTRYIAYAYALYCSPERFLEETQASATEAAGVAAAAGAVAAFTDLRKEIVDVSAGGIHLSGSEGYDGSGSFADPRSAAGDFGGADLGAGLDGAVDAGGGGGTPDGG